jgi:hypothetical protein
VFPIFGWGIGVVVNAWDADGREGVTEEQIQREIDRLRRWPRQPAVGQGRSRRPCRMSRWGRRSGSSWIAKTG